MMLAHMWKTQVPANPSINEIPYCIHVLTIKKATHEYARVALRWKPVCLLIDLIVLRLFNVGA